MRKLILSLIVAGITVAHISSSIAATPPSNYVGIFGTNSSQTNFVIPAGDSVYIARWFNQTDENGNLISYASATINNITKTVTDSITYVKGKPKIVTITNSITNFCNFVLNDANNPWSQQQGILIPGPASISNNSTAFQYKYFPKKSPYQVLTVPTGTTNSVSITIPAGQKLHKIKVIHSDESYYCNIDSMSLNNFIIPLGYGADGELSGWDNDDIYGPVTLKFNPSEGGTSAPFYFSYILINSDATNIPITTP